MNKKIAIITHYPLDPLHPRTEMIFQVLESKGYEMTIINPFINRTFIQKLSLRLFFGFFDFVGSLKTSRKINSYDLLIIQGLKYLPVSYYAKKKGIPVIYETLDNNIHLYFYHLTKKNTLLARAKIILTFYEKKEKKYIKKFCARTIVNSKALMEYFNQEPELIYYSSPLEGINNNPENKEAFLYLGSFERMKGALQILQFIQVYKKNLTIIGSIKEGDIKKLISENPSIVHYDRLPSQQLKTLLQEIFKRYYLLGISFTQEVNLSNKTQELNKDIDYLCMGVPIIGNHRGPTAEKIEKGCGVFFDNEKILQNLFLDKEYKKEISKHCIDFYNDIYSKDKFTNKLINLVNAVIR